MDTTKTRRIIKTISFAALACVVLASASVADAQYREDRWEFSLGTFYQLGTTTTISVSLSVAATTSPTG
jgi:hypothetical protein